MFVQNTQLSHPSIAPNIQNLSKSWKIGEILSAVVNHADGKGNVELKIGNASIRANTGTPLQAGENLRLQLVRADEQLVFKRLSNKGNRPQEGLVSRILRQDLPTQRNLKQSLARLEQLSLPAKPGKPASALQPPLKQALSQLKLALPGESKIIETAQLKKAIQDSGLFMEAKLAQSLSKNQSHMTSFSAGDFKHDIKANLLRVSVYIEQFLSKVSSQPSTSDRKSPSGMNSSPDLSANDLARKFSELIEIRNIVDSAISRIRLNQSHSLITEENTTPFWLVEIPVVDENGKPTAEIQLRYERPEQDQEQAVNKWNLKLTLDIEPLGKIHVKLMLEENTISSSLWAEKELTNQLISEHIPHLESRLEQAGLAIGSINQQRNANMENIKLAQRSPLLSALI